MVYLYTLIRYIKPVIDSDFLFYEFQTVILLYNLLSTNYQKIHTAQEFKISVTLNT